MSNRLTIPADLAALIEKRTQADRRASDEGRTGDDRRAEAAAPADDVPVRAAEPFALDAAAVPSELLERRKDGAGRE